MYATDVRTPKSILQLHNVAWMHHELCCDLIPIPKEQTRDKLYGTYLHDLVVHGPSQYQMMCLRSANAESTERLFSQVKHVSMRATNRKPDNVLTTVLLSMQAEEIVKTGPNATQDSIVSRVSKQVPPYKGTRVSKSFVNSRIQSWQAHLETISPYLEHGGVWWQAAEGGYTFFDSDSDSEYNSHGPDLMHFCTSSIQLIYKLSQEKWLSIIEKKTVLPTPYIRLFKDGIYDGRRYFPSCNEETEIEIDMGKHTRVGNSTTKQTEETDTTQENIQVSSPQDTCKSPCIQPTIATGQTPKSSHQLYPLTLLSEDTVDKSSASTEAITAASIECQMTEPEMEHTTYESKAATQISKAIENPKILTVFDKSRAQVKNIPKR